MAVEWRAYIFLVINFFGWLIPFAYGNISYLAFILIAGLPVVAWIYWVMFRNIDAFVEDLYVRTGIDLSVYLP